MAGGWPSIWLSSLHPWHSWRAGFCAAPRECGAEARQRSVPHSWTGSSTAGFSGGGVRDVRSLHERWGGARPQHGLAWGDATRRTGRRHLADSVGPHAYNWNGSEKYAVGKLTH